MIPQQFRFLTLVDRTQLSSNVFMALAAVVIAYLLINKTILGYKIRAVGSNPTAAAAGGIGVSGIAILSMALSGGLGGLAGTAEVLKYLKYGADGRPHRFVWPFFYTHQLCRGKAAERVYQTLNYFLQEYYNSYDPKYYRST
jgi:hypothetical protein